MPRHTSTKLRIRKEKRKEESCLGFERGRIPSLFAPPKRMKIDLMEIAKKVIITLFHSPPYTRAACSSSSSTARFFQLSAANNRRRRGKKRKRIQGDGREEGILILSGSAKHYHLSSLLSSLSDSSAFSSLP